MTKRALITGITGQDGSYLAEFLLGKGYEVWGLIRRSSSFNTGRIDHLYIDPHEQPRLRLVYGDMTDGSNLAAIIGEIKPDEVYNLAAQSHVRVSFDQPVYTVTATGLGTMMLLEAIRDTGMQVRFYQASSSEMFGKSVEVPQSETTPFHPRSPYGCAKVYAFWQTDWGFAGDYVEAMWLMLQQPQADDYVVATGESHSVREALELTFSLVGLDWKDFVKTDPRYLRPAEVDVLQGDAAKARRVLNWTPKVTFKELITMMVESDWELAREERVVAEHRQASGPKR